jgi:hypothetical protein
MAKYVIQEGVTLNHDGKVLGAGATVELSEEQAARKLARGDIKPAPAKAAPKPPPTNTAA